MTLRAKTRSRKGRDLKRLDGVKRRLTRRRRPQQQRGGGDVMMNTFKEWLDTVNKENSIFKEDSRPDLERDDYNIDLINADSHKHKLPLFTSEGEKGFAISDGEMDIRTAAVIVSDLLKHIMDRKPNAGEFKNEMIAQQQSADINDAEDVKSQLRTLADIETSIRRKVSSGDSPSEKSTKEIAASPVTILSDDKQYPLYIWALYYSAQIGDNSIPLLTSKQQVTSETTGVPIGSNDASKPASQEDTTP